MGREMARDPAKQPKLVIGVLGVLIALLLLLICLPVTHWNASSKVEYGLREYRSKAAGTWTTYRYEDYEGKTKGLSELKDAGGVAYGLIMTSSMLVLVTTFIIPMVSPAVPANAIFGFLLSMIAMVLEVVGWARWAHWVGDDTVDYGWCFVLAVVLFVLLLVYQALWLWAWWIVSDDENPESDAAYEDSTVPVLNLKFHDYDVDEEGSPVPVHGRGQFRCAGDSHMAYGFQLTGSEDGNNTQQGHFMCLIEFEATGNEIILKFEYNMHGEPFDEGEGLCAYLMDPTVPGWDSKFDG